MLECTDTFIIRELLKNDHWFNTTFEQNVKIWKRFIDDCFGMFFGREKIFRKFYNRLSKQFEKFGLELTMQFSRKNVTMLDIEVYKAENQLHTRESRKETASNLYLRNGSAHPSFTFKGIVKSQMYRLRRLCSKNDDFQASLEELRLRCYNSGYSHSMVDGVLQNAAELKREFTPKQRIEEKITKIRWVVLAGL